MIVLVGFMGSGKTTVARMLGARLGLPYVDTDALIERTQRRSIAEILRTEGEARFRELERAVVHRVLADHSGVVSLGGGAVADPSLRKALGAHQTVFLDVELAEALRRARKDGATRPLLDEHDPAELYSQRRHLYETVGDVTVDTTARPPHEVASEIVDLLGAGPDRRVPREIVVMTRGANYPVVIGAGVGTSLGELVARAEAEKAFLVIHPSLIAHASVTVRSMEAAGVSTQVLELPEGEASKSLDMVTSLYGRLAAARAHRNDVVVTFGGGVVSDVGGFLASTYMRGLPLVHVPSTLLGQVDASIGGKTGVNFGHGKNLVGTIYQPSAVLCDVDLLRTCPPEEIRSGLAEVLKYGFIADPSLIDFVETECSRILELDTEVIVEIVTRSVAVKASVVATDERETGDRAFLNYGHTFGHAFESVLGFGRIKHGEAVSLGMMAAAYTAAELGLVDDGVVDLHRTALLAVGLPVSGRFAADDVIEAWSQDKKYSKGARFVLLRGLGNPVAGVEAGETALRAALSRLARED